MFEFGKERVKVLQDYSRPFEEMGSGDLTTGVVLLVILCSLFVDFYFESSWFHLIC